MTQWIKPGRCESAHCLEFTDEGEEAISLRGTGPLSAPGDRVVVTRDEFRAFVQAAKAGEYDHV
jgi:hypothetical protein